MIIPCILAECAALDALASLAGGVRISAPTHTKTSVSAKSGHNYCNTGGCSVANYHWCRLHTKRLVDRHTTQLLHGAIVLCVYLLASTHEAVCQLVEYLHHHHHHHHHHLCVGD